MLVGSPEKGVEKNRQAMFLEVLLVWEEISENRKILWIVEKKRGAVEKKRRREGKGTFFTAPGGVHEVDKTI